MRVSLKRNGGLVRRHLIRQIAIVKAIKIKALERMGLNQCLLGLMINSVLLLLTWILRPSIPGAGAIKKTAVQQHIYHLQALNAVFLRKALQ